MPGDTVKMQMPAGRRIFVTMTALSLCVLFIPAYAHAQYILFNQSTDSVSLAGQTTLGSSVTYEAQVYFTSVYQGRGFIFNEWTNASEDKWFVAGPNQVQGFSFPAGLPGPLIGSATLSLNQWHHLVYVYNGTQDLFYADGSLIASRTASGPISNAPGGSVLGSRFRDGGITESVVGYLDSFRMSSTARYSGTSFIPPVGDMTNDANTLMLFNFNEAVGSTVLNDLSGNGHDGQLGVGFAGATSPEFVTAVPEPSTWVLVLSVMTLIIVYQRRNVFRKWTDSIWPKLLKGVS